MILHADELQLAKAYERSRPFDELSPEQVHLVMERGRALFKWYKAHPTIHNLIGASVLASIFVADGWIMLRLPAVFLATHNGSWSWALLASAAVACTHGWLLYSLSVYSLHEAAAHNAVFSGTGVLARAAQFLARNACRIAQGDPEYYAACHMGHHSKFGTKDDPEFLNFVLPHRLWMSLLPFAALINFTDFLAHRPMTYTRSRVITGIVGTTYHTIYGWLMFRAYGLLVPVVAFALVLNIALYFDRIRQFVEHNLMPLENRVGARSLGIGFWGLLIGGGYWGQPCHLAHHLVASVPWYQQIVLHRYIKGLLTPRQREQFLIRPVIGLPMLFWQIVRDANEFARLQSIGTHPPPHDH